MTDNTNVVQIKPLLDQLSDKLSTLVDRRATNKTEWVEISLGLCETLVQARVQFAHNMEFGAWLDRTAPTLNHQDRAALIRMGGDLKIAREVFDEAKSTAYQIIWRDSKDRFPVKRLTKVSKTPTNRQTQPKRLTNNPPQSREWTKRHPWFNRKRGQEINAAFVNKNAVWGINDVMTKIGKTGSDELWKMMIQCYDAGFIVESRYYPNGDHDPCSLRLLFPHTSIAYAKQFRMTNDRQRKYVRDNIVPAALANIDAVLADPENLEAIVAKHLGIHLDEPETGITNEVAAPPRKTQEQKIVAAKEMQAELKEFRNSMHPRYLSPQEVDPEFTGTPREFTAKYGHVQIHTAEQFATMRFADWSGYFKALAKYARGMPPLPEKSVDHNWLRNPSAHDVTKLMEALNYLRPLVAEAEALLATATAALEKKKA